MKNKGLIIFIIVTVALWLLQKKRAFDSLELRPTFPRNFRFQGTTLVFDLPINAFNGSSGTLNIGGADLRVYAENQYIGRAFAASNQQITPLGQSQLYTQVIVNLGDLGAAVPGFLNGLQDQQINIRLRGTMNVEGIYVNVDIPVTLPYQNSIKMDYDIVYNEDGTVSYVYEDGTVKTFQQTGAYITGGGTTTGGTTPTPGTTGTGKKWWEQLLGTIPAVIGGIFGSNNNAGNYPNTPYTPTTQQAGNSNIMIIAVAAVVVIFLLMKKVKP